MRRHLGLLAMLLVAGSASAPGAYGASPPPAPDTGAAACEWMDGTPLPPLHGPPPPETFDASTIPWVGDRFGWIPELGVWTGAGYWAGRLDGSRFQEIAGGDIDAVRVTPSGIVAIRSGALLVIDDDGAETTLVPDGVGGRLFLDADEGSAFIARSRDGTLTGDVIDLWRVPLDGETPTILFQDTPGSPDATAPDGTAAAWYSMVGDGGPSWTEVRVKGQAPRRIQGAGPIGFDASGRLLAMVAWDRAVRMNLRTGRTTTFFSGYGGPADALITPSGRTFIALGWDGRPAVSSSALTVRDLVHGGSRIWPLPDGDWLISETSDDRHVVLAGLSDGDYERSTEAAVIDLQEGWIGFIPFCPPAAAQPSAP